MKTSFAWICYHPTFLNSVCNCYDLVMESMARALYSTWCIHANHLRSVDMSCGRSVQPFLLSPHTDCFSFATSIKIHCVLRKGTKGLNPIIVCNDWLHRGCRFLSLRCSAFSELFLYDDRFLRNHGNLQFRNLLTDSTGFWFNQYTTLLHLVPIIPATLPSN